MSDQSLLRGSSRGLTPSIRLETAPSESVCKREGTSQLETASSKDRRRRKLTRSNRQVEGIDRDEANEDRVSDGLGNAPFPSVLEGLGPGVGEGRDQPATSDEAKRR